MRGSAWNAALVGPLLQYRESTVDPSTRKNLRVPATHLNQLATCEDPDEVLAHSPADVSGWPVTVLPVPAQADVRGAFHAAPCLFVNQQSSGRRWSTQGGRTLSLHSAPRMFEVYEAGTAFDRSRWQGEAGRCVMVEFRDDDVEAMTHGEIRTAPLRTDGEAFTASSTLASSSTTSGDFPPSSSRQRFRWVAHFWAMIRPTRVEPVKLTRRIALCAMSASTTSGASCGELVR